MGKNPIVYIISKLVVSVNVQIKEIRRQVMTLSRPPTVW